MPTKKRLEVKPNKRQTADTLSVAERPAAPVKVVEQAAGPVNVLDKLKGYYHTIITVIGAVLVLVNEVTPVTDFLGGNSRHWVSVAVVFLTAVVNFLKSNEHWVDDL
jgi:hypothetical protein